ncbi:MAG TPA: aminotransferase class V-fold PLP-dependent enzyme [Bryobacteraceae bacterium]|jgi:alanine-glyoxylate transaminase/serine-glyoxylate transaminase/serine-pyruvate transaminase
MLTIHPPKRFLFGPGPTQVEPRVYEAMSQPIVGYLDPYFFEVAEHVKKGLQQVFGTSNEMTLAISGTGSSGMETAVSNFVEPGSKFAVIVGGFFGERLCEMGRRHGANVVRLDKPWGEAATDDEAREFILKERPQTVAFVHGETSTGVLQTGKAICDAAHEVGALVIADCVTTLGGTKVAVDETGIDIAYSCTQKGLSCPPGLSPFTVSPRAVERLHARPKPNIVWYLDLAMIVDYYGPAHKYHHTAPISNFYALREGLALISEEGVEARWARHLASHEAFVRGLEYMGVSMHVAAGHRIPHLNTVRVPAGVDDAKVRKQLMAEYGIEIGAGFGPLAGKIFRIGLMGPLATPENTQFFLDAFAKSI